MLDAGPLEVITGELDHRPELPILLDLLADAEERASAAVLKRWVRRRRAPGRPLDHLLTRDFAAFEDALATLAERGFVIRRNAQGPSGSGAALAGPDAREVAYTFAPWRFTTARVALNIAACNAAAPIILPRRLLGRRPSGSSSSMCSHTK